MNQHDMAVALHFLSAASGEPYECHVFGCPVCAAERLRQFNQSEAGRAMLASNWASPSRRATVSKAMRRINSDATRRWMATPEGHAHMMALWASPKRRLASGAALRRWNQSPEGRAQQSERAKAMWRDASDEAKAARLANLRRGRHAR